MQQSGIFKTIDIMDERCISLCPDIVIDMNIAYTFWLTNAWLSTGIGYKCKEYED